MGEVELIARSRARCLPRPDVLLGIGDDAALLHVPSNCALCVSVDTLIAGVHFPRDTAAYSVGWKALAVNLSDMAAMGAKPMWATLALTLPEPDYAWLDGFLDGFFALAQAEAVALVGGDTTRGPLSITVTIHGLVAAAKALRRDAARVGDVIAVSGTLGDAAAGLRIDQFSASGGDHAYLRSRLDCPTPRVALGQFLAGRARAAVDISDGLLADLQHVLSASGLGADIEVDALPSSEALREAVVNPHDRTQLQCSGGDDYELLFTLSIEAWQEVCAEAERQAWQVTVIGRVSADTGLRLWQDGKQKALPDTAGWNHFGDSP